MDLGRKIREIEVVPEKAPTVVPVEPKPEQKPVVEPVPALP